MIKIIIADDHTIVRRGLREILTDDDHQIIVVGEARNGAELLNFIGNNPVDVVILDISMPGRNGLEVLKDIKRIYPNLPVIILSMYPEDQYAIRAFKNGAASYMTKESAPEELIEAVKKVHRGGKHVSLQVAELLAGFIETTTPDSPHESLSDREFEVFGLLANGKTVGQIAENLNLSIKTISTYRTRILEKMRMSVNAELTRYAIERKII